MAIRAGLVKEVVSMAFDTVRTNKMRSGLTVLGVVIGITSIVGMTALIRGFDQSLRDMIRAIGPSTIFVQRFGVTSFAGGAELSALLKRPNLSLSDARALEEQSTTLEFVDLELGAGPGRRPSSASSTAISRPSRCWCSARPRTSPPGRAFRSWPAAISTAQSCNIAGTWSCSATRRTSCCSNRPASIRSASSCAWAAQRFEIVGVFDKRPSAGGFSLGQDDFVVVPYTSYQRVFGLRVGTTSTDRGTITNIQISVLPRDGVNQADAIADVERIMRIRHGLKLDEPDDFDISTQDQFLQLWDRISQGTFFALIVISSIALMVGGIGVMAIMSITVTERTREIGVRKALGARRAEILFQFLMEATFLTSAGGLLGIALGASIGWTVHLVSGFPISLPWWSFAIGIGFSAAVGIFFGMYPAIKASRLDPIEALRYE